MRKEDRSRAAPPEGFRYEADVLSPDDERQLALRLGDLALQEFEFHGYVARRRVISFGWRYDFGDGRLRLGAPFADCRAALCLSAAGHRPQ